MKGSTLPIRKVGDGRKPWLLDCRYVGGSREFYATKAEAERHREEKAAEVRRYGASALNLTAEERSAFVQARDRLAKLGATIEQAVEYFARYNQKTEPVLFSAGIAQIVESKRASNLDAEYVRKLEAHLESLMRTTTDKSLDLVTREEIEAWLFKSEWKPATIRSLRIDVRTFFRFALKRGWVNANPAAHIEPIKLPDAPPGILTPDEAEALMRAARANSEPLPYVTLNLLCGIRPEECVQLAPDNIQIDRGFVEVPSAIAKSRQRRIVDLSDNAKEWLKIAPAIKSRSPKWYARQIPALKAEASKILGRPMPWPKNALRHSFASYHLAMHGSADKTATQMGHRSTDMLFRHYRELVTPENARKFWGIMPTDA